MTVAFSTFMLALCAAHTNSILFLLWWEGGRVSDLLLGLFLTEGAMALAHRYVWHDPFGVFRIAAAMHSTHHRYPFNPNMDAQDILGTFTGLVVFLLLYATSGSLTVAAGAQLHHMLSMIVHDEMGHGRALTGGPWRGSEHFELHHQQPSKHTSVLWLEASQLAEKLSDP